MLNGSPKEFFKSNRGIRQDYPLSSYLFVVVMKLWSITMDIAIASRDIRPFKRNGNVVSHLLFADDMLVYCKGDEH